MKPSSPSSTRTVGCAIRCDRLSSVLGSERSCAPRANPEVVSDYPDCGSALRAPQDSAHNHQAQRASLIEQGRPIDQKLDLLANWQNFFGFQENTAARDVRRGGLRSVSRQDILSLSSDRKSLMLPTFVRSELQAGSGGHSPSFFELRILNDSIYL